MSKDDGKRRLFVNLDDDEHDMLEWLSRASECNKSDWVRLVIRKAYDATFSPPTIGRWRKEGEHERSDSGGGGVASDSPDRVGSSADDSQAVVCEVCGGTGRTAADRGTILCRECQVVSQEDAEKEREIQDALRRRY
jgi:hypothetical protein